ncbi:hypothetical protein HQ545_02920 [Candidatus Woesearchaeota archaeon]|nr:hypothetical protein [Candidatus Woesearchaeota archaeon]
MKKILVIGSGGRVLGVTGYSSNGIFDAQKLAYEAVSKIIKIRRECHTQPKGRGMT